MNTTTHFKGSERKGRANDPFVPFKFIFKKEKSICMYLDTEYLYTNTCIYINFIH